MKAKLGAGSASRCGLHRRSRVQSPRSRETTERNDSSLFPHTASALSRQEESPLGDQCEPVVPRVSAALRLTKEATFFQRLTDEGCGFFDPARVRTATERIPTSGEEQLVSPQRSKDQPRLRFGELLRSRGQLAHPELKRPRRSRGDQAGLPAPLACRAPRLCTVTARASRPTRSACARAGRSALADPHSVAAALETARSSRATANVHTNDFHTKIL